MCAFVYCAVCSFLYLFLLLFFLQLFLNFLNVFLFVHEKPDFAHSGNRNSRQEEFALVIKRVAIIKACAAGFRFVSFFSYVLFTSYFPVSDLVLLFLYLLLFLCTPRFSFPVVTVRLPVALDLGQRSKFNHYWSLVGCLFFSPYFFSCVPPSLVRQLGNFPRSDAWSLDPSFPSASSSRGCIQRAVKIAHGKGTWHI
ncbi:hypothetical protein J3F84DRAFT_57470 [Trichoderma pleuroticola]